MSEAPRISFDRPAADVAALCRELVRAQALNRPPSPWRRRAAELLALAGGAVALFLDARAGGPHSPLAPVAGVALACLVWAGCHPRDAATPARHWLARLLLTIPLAALALAFVVLVEPMVEARSGARDIWRYPLLAVIALIGAGLLNAWRNARAQAVRPADTRPLAVAEVLEALADDVGTGRPISGWLDLRGFALPEKLLRKAKTPTGWEVSFFRDEWLRLVLPLRDGGRLRLSAVDRVKDRAGRFKRGRSGKNKWKAGRTESQHLFDVRLAFDAARYRLRAPEAGATKAGSVVVTGIAAADGQLCAQIQSPQPAPAAADLLAALAFVHRHLEPAGGAR
ncbi:MAG: hypothetical protein AB7O37_18870 [Vicinamibacteria bacterium]